MWPRWHDRAGRAKYVLEVRGAYILGLESAVEGCKLAQLQALVLVEALVVRLQQVLDHLGRLVHILLYCPPQ